MIVKSLTRKTKSWGQLLEYMDRDRKKGRGEASFVVKQNVTGDTPQVWAKAFAECEQGRVHHRIDNVRAYHLVISWSNKDAQNLTPEKMQSMTKKFLELWNENAVAIALPHQDKSHWHVHCALSGVEIKTGRAIRISRDRFKSIKLQLQNYQIEKYPELSHSIVNHGIAKTSEIKEQEFQLIKRTKTVSEKDRIKKLLAQQYKSAQSKADFLKRIAEAGLSVYERNGKLTGLIVGNRKMRFKSLGFEEPKIAKLDERQNSLNQIQSLRTKASQHIEKSEDFTMGSRFDLFNRGTDIPESNEPNLDSQEFEDDDLGFDMDKS